ncbi:SAM-dependent methyltransferase, partial [Streptomyces sp. RPT161]|uniref:SAM-dependent methyltransferase n=1 Tax=Streptomyces sp. RPT161 TaxID=3015993 RepID=UPI0022B88106
MTSRVKWSGPSRTSQAVAVTRAELDRPCSEQGDPQAQRRLCAGMRAVRIDRLRSHLAARTRFFDEQVLAAVASGIRQVVVLGAGYDDRALRFRSPGVRFFELDHPATQTDKARRLAELLAGAAGPVLAPADFRQDDVAAVLEAHGHDAERASLFICEGLLVYLDQPTILRLLGRLRSRAAGGSVLAASLAVHPEGEDSEALAAAANARRRAGRSEPWRTILPAPAHLDLLVRSGWRSQLAVDDAQLDDAAPPGRSLLVAAQVGDQATGTL